MKKINLKIRHFVIITVLVIVIIVTFPFVEFIVVVYVNHVDMDDVKYDNSFVIGNTYDAIVDEYGDFDIIYGTFETIRTECCYLVKEKQLNGQPLYYCVVFDENKIAYKTFLAGPKGG
jgi:hypothetical protein